MPELPEVETVRRSLLPVVLDKTIEQVDVYVERILQNQTRDDFKLLVEGTSFRDLKRRGKYLIFELSSSLELVAHLRMTGRLIYVSNQDIPLEKHTSVVFSFGKGDALRFEDVRKFATLDLVPQGDYSSIQGLYTMGPEPLLEDFTLEHFKKTLTGRGTKIKGFLLDQTKVAGLGNIYVDESLFMAGIHPERPASSLKPKEVARLHRSIKEVLQLAIDNQGTTLKDYRTGYGQEGEFQNKLQIYGKKGESCPRCGVDLEYKKVVGRTSHFCPHCQRSQP